METLSRIIAELNERFGLNLRAERRVTLDQMLDRLDDDAALDAAARVDTRENVRLTFDQKIEHVIQEIVDSNFDLYMRITDDRPFGEAVDLLIDVADDGAIVGTERDQLESDDRFMRLRVQAVRNGLGDRAGTRIDPKCQVVQGKTVCGVSCYSAARSRCS
ncbi:MAG: hypothetical protein IT386_17115 [Deltaproteobacteria bacterium]|nr:hypothetical protein [Deltaproteobacteria bacterium]